MKNALCTGAALAALTVAAYAAEAEGDKKKWDVAAPPMETRKISIDVTEGTWMNVDVSPDGRTIAFDLLGDIYTMPITGGAPVRIASGLPFEMQPKFSPDGAKIAFTSDRGGGDNLWIMNRDGSDKRAVTKETFRLLNSPDWTPDGKYLIGRKHFTTGRSLGTGEIWLYHLGGGDGVKLVKRPNEAYQKELGEPVFAPGGKSLYFSRNTTPGDTFQYAQDSNDEVFAIDRFDIATGETTRIAGGAGGAVRPAPSPDGNWLAFVKRERAKSKLYLKDLATGEERKIYDALDQDVQETWAVHGVYPAMDWTPDSRSVVFWAGGKIRRVNLDGAASDIPFRIADDRDVVDPPRPAVEVAPDVFDTTVPRFAAVSPDGRSAVFETLGKLYLKSLPNGTPRRLTGSNEGFELFPSYSRDGKRVVYVSWTDDGMGVIRTVSAGGGSGSAVTATPGIYRRPRFSPDGKTIVFEKGASGNRLSGRYAEAPGVYRIAAGGGTMTRVSSDGGAPHFGAENDRVFMSVFEEEMLKLVSVDLNGEARRVHASGDLLADYQVAPDGKHLAFRENWAAYVMPMTTGPQETGAGKSATALPVVKASDGGAAFLGWTNDGAIHWSLGPTLFRAFRPRRRRRTRRSRRNSIRRNPACRCRCASPPTNRKASPSSAMPASSRWRARTAASSRTGMSSFAETASPPSAPAKRPIPQGRASSTRPARQSCRAISTRTRMARRPRMASFPNKTTRRSGISRSASRRCTTRRTTPSRFSRPPNCNARAGSSPRASSRPATSSTARKRRASFRRSTATTTRSRMSGGLRRKARVRSRITISRAAISVSRSSPRRKLRT
jgi:Tol biopolymer transport system component